MIFILAGISFRHIAPRLRSKVWVSVALLAGSAAFIVTKVSRPPDMKQGDFGTPVVSVVIASAISAGLVLLVQWAFASITPRVAGVVTSAATVGLAVVLTHTAFILLLSKLPVDIPAALVFLIVLVLSWALAYFVSQTPLGTVLTGAGTAAAQPPPAR